MWTYIKTFGTITFRNESHTLLVTCHWYIIDIVKKFIGLLQSLLGNTFQQHINNRFREIFSFQRIDLKFQQLDLWNQ